MKESLFSMREMELALNSPQMETYIMANGKMTREMVLVIITRKTTLSILETGKTASIMEKGHGSA
jgi:hypothetical protein